MVWNLFDILCSLNDDQLFIISSTAGEGGDKLRSEAAETAYRKWKKQRRKRGVIYIARVPFGSTPRQIRKIFTEFGDVTQVHLEVARGDDGADKKIHGQWTEFCECWVEFKEKKIAKRVARLLHDTQVPKKYVKNRKARNHVWNMKYLKGFGWHHLNEYKNTVRTLQQKKYEIKIADAERQASYFEAQVERARKMTDKWGPRSQWGKTGPPGIGGGDGDWGPPETAKSSGFGSSDDALGGEPPMKKPKLVEQRKFQTEGGKGNLLLLKRLRRGAETQRPPGPKGKDSKEQSSMFSNGAWKAPVKHGEVWGPPMEK